MYKGGEEREVHEDRKGGKEENGRGMERKGEERCINNRGGRKEEKKERNS